MKFLIVVFFVCIALLLLNNCDSTDPKLEPELALELKDVSCTETWLQLTTTNIQLPATINLLKNNSVTQTFSLSTQDSLIYIDSLLPNQSYSFQASSIQNPVSSNKVTTTTLDTTSHNFTWQTFEFGDIGAGSSLIYDVAIINENDIWAVGEIYMNDSLGNPDPNAYNAVHWNGQSWELKRIMFYTFCPQGPGEGSYPASSIFAFDNENIVISSGSQIAYIKNGIQIKKECVPVSVNKILGASLNDFYIVGYGGGIARYNGSSWTKIESGTTLGLSDVFGNETSAIYACGGNLNTGQGIILKINSNNTVSKIIDSYYYGTGFDSTKMFEDNLYGPLVGIWVAENGNIYTVGNLIYRFNKIKWDYAKGIEYNYLGAGEFSGRGFLWDVSGTANNDFFFVGQRNTIRHFNGINAIQLGEPFSYTSEYSWLSVDYKINVAVTVGRKGGNAAINIFKR